MMKKYFTLLIAALLSVTAFSQIVLVPGKFTTKDGKGFVVIEHEGTQAELFEKVKSRLTFLYNDPDKVLSENKPNIITVNGISSGISFKIWGQTYHPQINYKINIYFKDGRFRIDAPVVIGSICDENRAQAVYSISAEKQGMMSNVYPVFKQSGTVRNEEMKESMEDYFNRLFLSISTDLDKTEGPTAEDW